MADGGELRRLFAHLAWADAQTLAGLVVQRSTPQQALERFMHVIAAEHVWLSRIRGVQPTVAVWPPYSPKTCAELQARNHAEFEALLAGDAAVLERDVGYVNSAGQPFTSSVRDILLHIALHGAWHRGQVATLLRAAGLEPTPTDYIAWVRGAPAATRFSSSPRDAR